MGYYKVGLQHLRHVTGYVGDWQNNKMHGQGTYTYADGDIYVGEWKNGTEDGQGTYTFGSNSGWVQDIIA